MDLTWGVKLFASPLLIGLASLAGRRWGPTAAGLLGGLPLVGGPVIIAIWLEQGLDYTQPAVAAAPAGMWANIVYMLVVGYASARWAWYAAIPLGWLCYLLAALLLDASGLARALWLGLAALPALFLAARLALPKPRAMPAPVHLPRAELFARMAAAALLVLTLTTVTRQLGSQFTGLLSGAPVAAVVIPAFTFATAGRDALLLTLSGFLTGLVGFGVCFLVLAYTMTALGFWALMPALIAGVACGLLSTHWAAAQRRARV